MTEWLFLAISVGLMVACGLFVAAEFSFVTVDRATVERKAAEGDRRATGVLKGLKSLSTQLSSAQLGITLTNLGIGWLAEPAIGQIFSGPIAAAGLEGNAERVAAYTIALGLSTFVTMLIGELIPKNFAISLPLATAKATQTFQRGFTKVMAWPIRGLNNNANAILRSWGLEPTEELRSPRTAAELQSLVLTSAEEGSLHGDTARLVARSIAFGDRTAADVQTPRVQVHFLDHRDSAADLLEEARASGHSRFPVTGKGGPDDIIGLIHVKHAVAIPAERRRSTRLSELVVPATIVPDTIELDPLLVELRSQGLQMAVVTDEYGGTDGIVTLEDLVEEIVGEIADEHDPVAAHSRHRIDGTWSVSGLLRPDEVADVAGVLLPEEDDYETIAGLILKRLGRLAVVGDVVDLEIDVPGDDDERLTQTIRLAVERLDGRRIDRVSIIAEAPGGEEA